MQIQDLPERYQEMLPLPDPRKEWQRFDCPMCGKTRAAVNYHTNAFVCYHCSPDTIWRIDEYAIREYREQIKNIVGKVKQKFGKWIPYKDLLYKAREFVWVYSEGESGQPNDAGKLWEWESDGDIEKARRFVGQALKGDLMNWANTEVQRKQNGKRNQNAGLAQVSGNEFSAGDAMARADEGIIRLRYRNVDGESDLDFDYAYIQMAENDAVPFKSWGSEILRCDKMRNGVGPIKGHCHWCNRALRNDDMWEHKYRNHVAIIFDSDDEPFSPKWWPKLRKDESSERKFNQMQRSERIFHNKGSARSADPTASSDYTNDK